MTLVLALLAYSAVIGVGITLWFATIRSDSGTLALLGTASLLGICVFAPTPVKVAIWSGVSREDKVGLALAAVLTIAAGIGVFLMLKRLGMVDLLVRRFSGRT